jgi:hypothetical protein
MFTTAGDAFSITSANELEISLAFVVGFVAALAVLYTGAFE